MSWLVSCYSTQLILIVESLRARPIAAPSPFPVTTAAATGIAMPVANKLKWLADGTDSLADDTSAPESKLGLLLGTVSRIVEAISSIKWAEENVDAAFESASAVEDACTDHHGEADRLSEHERDQGAREQRVAAYLGQFRSGRLDAADTSQTTMKTTTVTAATRWIVVVAVRTRIFESY